MTPHAYRISLDAYPEVEIAKNSMGERFCSAVTGPRQEKSKRGRKRGGGGNTRMIQRQLNLA